MFLKLLKNTSGASAAEYALILAIVGGLIAAAALTLGQSISGAMDNAAGIINNGAGGASNTTGGGNTTTP